MKFFTNYQETYYDGPIFIFKKDGWNDWFKWYTLYNVSMINKDGIIIDLGGVKIGRRGMSEANGVTQIPDTFPYLDDSYFSLGQNENYYETLISLGNEIREEYLRATRDCAYSLNIFDDNLAEPVMQESILRDIEENRVRERLHTLASGRITLTPYSFEYHFPTDLLAFSGPPVITFDVRPRSLPATNIHVLIGRNGVGKTRCFDFLARAFLGMPSDDPQQDVGTIINTARGYFGPFGAYKDPGFAGLVTVSFSAFDSKGPLGGITSGQKRYAYIGLVTHETARPHLSSDFLQEPRLKSVHELSFEFSLSVLACREGVRRQRWKGALTTLEADPLFAEANVSELADDEAPDLEERARTLFKKMSSGHAIVLLSITRLVELVEEKSLVLLDEPESHLHPPLLSAFIRALSNLLIERNGVAIVATHSPVVLQEVPRSCVWKLSRSGHEVRADRTELETFGENVGVLTREVFGLEVTQTGFHRLIADKVQGQNYDQIIAEFGGQLGAEGRALARALSLLSPTQLSTSDPDD